MIDIINKTQSRTKQGVLNGNVLSIVQPSLVRKNSVPVPMHLIAADKMGLWWFHVKKVDFIIITKLYYHINIKVCMCETVK